MKIQLRLSAVLFALILIFIVSSCGKNSDRDIKNDSFPEAQTELREVLKSIIEDAETANIEGLQNAHLNSDKFTKFGPRNFKRHDVASTNKSEETFFSSISDYKQEIKDLKIDVFGDISIVTYYPQVSFIQNGEAKSGSGRQTFVFLKTEKGWKIVHEHGTPEFNSK